MTAAVFALILVGRAFGQAPDKPTFEVADIKPSDPSARMPGKGRMLPGGRIEMAGGTLNNLIMVAYGVQENMIVGGPKWAASDRYDIVAKMGGDPDMNKLRSMIETLLADRFQLVIHREKKEMPAYVLSVGKRAAKFTQGSGGQQNCNWTTLESGLAQRTCKNMTMEEFARQMPGMAFIGIDAPVVDQTGLKGAYDFQLEVGMRRGNGEGELVRKGAAPSSVIPDSGPTIFMALDQIGLKLESRKMPLDVIVVDRAEKPSGN